MRRMNDAEVIVVLINPQSAKLKSDKILDIISSVLHSRLIKFICFKEEWPALINIYKEVWLIGGDGTMNYFLNYYKEILIPIAIFKGGTGNDFSWKLYGNISIAEQINKI